MSSMEVSEPAEWLVRRVALVSTGTEILQGMYADTNARFLAEELTGLGVQVVSIAAAPDDEEAIERILRFSASQADLVICTGGIGPTGDDRNRYVYERVLELPLELDEHAVAGMRGRFRVRNYGEMPRANEVQGMLPRGCVPFYNQWGTAPGFLVRPTGEGVFARCGLIAMPGPPMEMMPMFNELVKPALAGLLPGGRARAIRTLHTYGHPESHIGSLVADMFCGIPGLDFTILASREGVHLRLCVTAGNVREVAYRLDELESQVRQRIGDDCVYGMDGQSLAGSVGELLTARKAWVSTAESCTGGMVAQLLTEVAGSSAYLGECYVTYSNDAKMKLVGVREETLKQHGAVSEETAREMADGARKGAGSDYAISVTGVAGPGGGSEDKPVGLVYIGVAGPTRTVVSREQLLGDRVANREQSARIALNLLRLELLRG